ncbi:Bicoid-interacting protein 3-domain-containing protein [Fomitopsis serialis]|uniref:Bicoid-interacting protein 3-domain-containing protein n=1 Tax=Fomitopsis serialis TaxID=139415 RepID=UPI0020073C2C|nr:Bicoid-interacting protein 3-domain-containing protein [Neoantrodia serialis]KAH9938345.1 Bicoid-interacting protein 3-domain-containing protein [Neoantrodia serialis]
MTAPNSSTPIHGNYHGYYTKRPFANDPRVAVLPSSIFAGARVLDVGCNEGWVTCEIAQSKGARKVVGVDIDDKLVRLAWKRRRYVWSLQEPSTSKGTMEDEMPPARKRRKVDANGGGGDTLQADYFPASFEHMFGPLPIPPVDAPDGPGRDEFPHNVTFRAVDWVNMEILEDKDGYDVALAFSISKWIHLNGEDEGLMRFFRRIHSVLRLGGTFVLEPQEWESYHKARRMNPKLKSLEHLKLRPNDFEKILQEIGFGPPEHLGQIGEGGFKRPIDVYTKLR